MAPPPEAPVALVLAVILALCPAASADPRASVAGQACAPGTAVSASALADNFVPAMDDLNTNVSAHGFGTSAVGGSGGPNTVFGLGQCMRDLSPVDCKLCFAEVRSLLPKCYPRVGGRLYLDGCFGRYGNYSFFGEALDAAADDAVCGSAAEGGNYTGAAGPRAFTAAVRTALANVTAAAVAPGSLGFGAGSAASGGATAFALAQCWESLNATACAQCLRAASGAVAPCAPATEGRALFAGCYLRYSTRRFWNVNATAGSSSSGTTIQIRKPLYSFNGLPALLCYGMLGIACSAFSLGDTFLTFSRLTSVAEFNSMPPNFDYIQWLITLFSYSVCVWPVEID